MGDRQDCKLHQAGAVAFGSGSRKSSEPDDPMAMQAEAVTGDPRVMLECLIEEFARMGWNARQITQIFEKPFFLASYGLARQLGDEAVQECIQQTLQRCGVLRCVISESRPTQEPQVVNLSTGGDHSPHVKENRYNLDGD